VRLRAEGLARPLRARYERVDLAADVPLTRAYRSGDALFFDRAEDVTALFPDLAEDVRAIGMQASAAIPVPDPAGSARPFGALTLVWTTPRDLDVSDRAALLSLTAYVGQAVARIRRTNRVVRAVEGRYADTRAAVLTMQRSLLSDLPVLPYADVAAHYQPADAELAAGGDWYDSTPLPDGRLALVVGDVVGHGPTAAAAMAQLRAVGNHLLHAGADPVSVLAQLDAAAARGGPTRATSVLLAVLEPTGRLSWASHGHPGPLVVSAAGRPRYLPTDPAAPLGVGGPAAGWQSTRLEPGDVVLLFTDGLVEQPDRPLPIGLEALLAVVERSRPAGAGRTRRPWRRWRPRWSTGCPPPATTRPSWPPGCTPRCRPCVPGSRATRASCGWPGARWPAGWRRSASTRRTRCCWSWWSGRPRRTRSSTRTAGGLGRWTWRSGSTRAASA